MKPIPKALDNISALGYLSVVGGIMYLVLAWAAHLVNGNLVGWTFCGTLHRLGAADWCALPSVTGWVLPDHVILFILNLPLPWFMIVAGITIIAFCSALVSLYDYRRPLRDNRD